MEQCRIHKPCAIQTMRHMPHTRYFSIPPSLLHSLPTSPPLSPSLPPSHSPSLSRMHHMPPWTCQRAKSHPTRPLTMRANHQLSSFPPPSLLPSPSISRSFSLTHTCTAHRHEHARLLNYIQRPRSPCTTHHTHA